jgi:S-adenosylmethionine synthetase
MIETFGTEHKPISIISDFVKKLTQFQPTEVIERLCLRRPLFQKTATYGHFGRPEFVWETIV